jgi:nicotinamidase-related amidase
MTLDYDFKKMSEAIYGSFNYTRGMEIDLARTALVIVDLQPALTGSQFGQGKAFSKILNTGVEYFENRVRETVVPNNARLLEFFRARDLTVVYVVTWSETEDLSDMPRYQRRTIRHWEDVVGEQLYRKWNDGMGVWDEIKPQVNETVCPKRTGSAFTSSTIDFCLRQAGIETIVLTGCNTNGCVFETGVVGKNLGYEFILVSDATACFHPLLQDEAEVWFNRNFGPVHTTDETIEMLTQIAAK